MQIELSEPKNDFRDEKVFLWMYFWEFQFGRSNSGTNRGSIKSAARSDSRL